jgi:hypothetical protein
MNVGQPTMNAKRFQEVLDALGIETLRGASHFLGVTERTIARWITKDHVSRPVAMLLELMLEKGLTPEEVLTIGKVRPAQIKFIMNYLRDNRRAEQS